MSEEIFQIDIDKVFKSKNPSLYKLLPKFIFRYIKKIIHQDFMNDFLRKNGHKYGIEFIEGAFKDFKISYQEKGGENIPEEGRFIFASNHPLGGFDGLILIACVSKYFSSVRFMVNDILLNLKNFEPIFVPINKHGGQAKDSVKIIDEIYASDHQVLYFPYGLVSRKSKGKIVDLEWKKSFIAKAKKHKRDVIPVHVSGGVSNRFYRIANFRKFLGIKWNLEMFYLPDEMYKHIGKSFTITFGKPISYQSFDNSKTTQEWASFVKEKAYKLANSPE